jgi:hypothetical protein
MHVEKATMRETGHAEDKHSSDPGDTSRSQFGDETVLHLPLEGILPPGHVLAVQTHLSILAHLSCEFGEPHLLRAQRFTVTEMCLILPLLQQHPAYCPYEVLLAHFTSTRVTDETITRAWAQLYEAQETGIWESLMRPIRNVLTRARFRLGDLGIGVVSMFETGYMLKPVRRPK